MPVATKYWVVNEIVLVTLPPNLHRIMLEDERNNLWRRFVSVLRVSGVGVEPDALGVLVGVGVLGLQERARLGLISSEGVGANGLRKLR